MTSVRETTHDPSRDVETVTRSKDTNVIAIDKAAERSYGILCNCPLMTGSPGVFNRFYYIVRKLDIYLLPFLSIMYFFNAIDRVYATPPPPNDVSKPPLNPG